MEAYQPSAQPSSEVLDMLENLSRRRKSARGVNAVVVVKSGEPGQEQTRKPEATLTPVAPSERLGMVVSEAVATAIATQSEIAERYIEAAGRIHEFESRIRELESERDRLFGDLQTRDRTHAREREILHGEFQERLARVEAERDFFAAELDTEKRRSTHEMVERLAEALSPRISGVLDEHTSLADRYAAAVHRIGELETLLERHKPVKVDVGIPSRPWWRFWSLSP
jgi:hypothetical protein